MKSVIHNKIMLAISATLLFTVLLVVNVSVTSETIIPNHVETMEQFQCSSNLSVSVGLKKAIASSESDPEHCEQDCGGSGGGSGVTCYATYDDCWFNCTTFWRCNPNGDCFTASGKKTK